MEIGYFSNSNIKISETFVYDLLKGLYYKHNDIVFFSGEKKKSVLDFDVKVKNAGFNFENSYLTFLNKLSLKFPKYRNWYATVKNKTVIKCLEASGAQHIDVAYVDYATNGVLLMEFFKKYNIPFVVHIHGYDITSKMRDLHYKKQFNKLINWCSYFVVASDSMRRILVLNGCPEEKIKLIRLGVNAKLIQPLSWEEKFKKPNQVVSLGRLTPKKNPIASLLAFKKVTEVIPSATFTIIGDGELKEEVLAKIKALKLENNVILLGALPRKEAFKVIQDKTVFIQHSVTALTGDQEGFAISLAEAQMFKIPVVSTIHNGITENVIDQKTGFLVQEYDYETMAEKITELLQNKDLCKTMGEEGRLHISKLCNTDNRVTSILLLLNEINKV
ncbi:glycosyltransferase family 4 protein [Winogradskyella endarachnes]|uniref:Glycosyltransferase n=1 Tax=Winogradskyella endarachnes TaxID=2681965 RepID=A0A6L6U6S1_9FLAO|nr:glycosyltransferase family 4 protein [Winogradskyella endarachnes]MUU77868.1 glycosyltransferase [Winogradskyella endarachnes]